MALDTTRLPPNRCPTCKYLVDAATGLLKPVTPAPGDYSCCLNCGAFLVFKTDLTVRASSLGEILADAELDRRSRAALLRARGMIERRGFLPRVH